MRQSADLQPIPLPLFEQALVLASGSRYQQLQRHSADVQPVPLPPSEQAISLAFATHAHCVSRWSVEAQGVPIHQETALLAANAATTRTVVRVTMEAVL